MTDATTTDATTVVGRRSRRVDTLNDVRAETRAANETFVLRSKEAGERIPGPEAETLAAEEIRADVGLARREAAAVRQMAGPQRDADSDRGVVTQYESALPNLCHAEIHPSSFRRIP